MLAAIVTSSEDAIIGEDLKHTITTWEQGGREIFGYSGSMKSPPPHIRLVPDDGVSPLDETMERILKGEYQQHFLMTPPV